MQHIACEIPVFIDIISYNYVKRRSLHKWDVLKDATIDEYLTEQAYTHFLVYKWLTHTFYMCTSLRALKYIDSP